MSENYTWIKSKLPTYTPPNCLKIVYNNMVKAWMYTIGLQWSINIIKEKL